MTLEEAANTGRSEGNIELAQQWIDDLKKTNARLNKLWPLLLVIVVVLGVSSIYFYYQLNEAAQIHSEKLAQINDKSASQEQIIVSLKTELKSLNEAASDLEAKTTSATTELSEKDRLIESLELKVAQLESGVLEANKALLISKKDIVEVSQKNQSELDALTEKYNAYKKDMSKTLKDRKVAYNALAKRHKETKAEMERLATALDRKEAELQRAKNAYELSRQTLVNVQNDFAQVKIKNQSLEDKVSSLIAPINDKAHDSEPSSTTGEAPANLENKDSLAFQPITASAPKAVTSKTVAPEVTNESKTSVINEGSSALEFDSIAID